MPDKPPIIEAPATVVPPRASHLDTSENLAAQTTAEQDKRTASQRTINNVWEYTQSAIALSVVVTTCIGIFIGRIIEKSPEQLSAFPPEWWTILGLVIGFYFGRTNHTRPSGQS